jgi:uracil-DNA glycosylase
LIQARFKIKMIAMILSELTKIQKRLEGCRACKNVCGTPVHGPAIETEVMLIGQAPGVHESDRGRPFAHTAGKTLFRWLGEATGLTEEELRQSIYISAVARCFPGKPTSGSGDREPTSEEIENCRPFLKSEFLVLKPELILTVGKLAIREVLGPVKFPKSALLADVVGLKIKTEFHGRGVEVIALPHPSGVSRWHQTEPGKSKLREALGLVGSSKWVSRRKAS